MNHFGAVTFTKHLCIATHPFRLWMVMKVLHHCVEGARKIKIVTVNKSENVAGYFFQSFIDRVHLSTIFLTDPVGESMFVLFDNVYAVVRAAAVDNNIFKVVVPLVKN